MYLISVLMKTAGFYIKNGLKVKHSSISCLFLFRVLYMVTSIAVSRNRAPFSTKRRANRPRIEKNTNFMALLSILAKIKKELSFRETSMSDFKIQENKFYNIQDYKIFVLFF